jgi:hypothetical protein
MLNHSDVLKQSRAVYKQFGESVWIPNCKKNAVLPNRKDANDLRNVGLGKVLVCVAMGASLEEQIETIKENRSKFDIIACDKAFGVLLDHGITSDFVLLADANIPFKWLAPYVESTEGVKLIATAYANPEWTAVWKGPKYFYLNTDSIDSQKIFAPIIGEDTRVVPAGSNVSNALLTFMTGCIGDYEDNFANYEAYILIGYDYSWFPSGNYYAFSNPVPKSLYMAHMNMLDIQGNSVRTSENLVFSAKWLWMYAQRYRHLNIVNCSGRGLLDIPRRGDFAKTVARINNSKENVQAIVSNFHKARASYEQSQKDAREFMQSKGALWQ